MKMFAWMALLLFCAQIHFVVGNRYECDTAGYVSAENSVYNLGYDQVLQQEDIDDFNDVLDEFALLSSGNSSCGSLSPNADTSEHSVLFGGCENQIDDGADYSAIGGGSRNWAYVDGKMSAIGGGLHCITTGDWCSISGGVKNKAYSNYATVSGGYLNKANAKFAVATGGSRNTVSGRHSTSLGMKTKVTGDFSIGLGFNGGSDCAVRGDSTFGMCTDQFILSGEYGEFDAGAALSDLASSSRRLQSVTKDANDLQAENEDLELQLRRKIEALLNNGRLDKDVANSIKAMLPSL